MGKIGLSLVCIALSAIFLVQVTKGTQRKASVPLNVSNIRDLEELIVNFSPPHNNINRFWEQLETIHTRFRAVALNFTSYIDDRTILSRIAAYNRHNMVDDDNGKGLLSVHIFIEQIIGLNDLEKLIERVRMANQMAPTVASIIFPHGGSKTYQEDLVNSYVPLITNSNIKVKIGLNLDIDLCQNSSDLVYLNEIKYLDLLFVKIPWVESYHTLGTHKTLLLIRSIMENCRRNLGWAWWYINYPGRLGFVATWPDTNSSGTKRNQTELVWFWTGIARISKELRVAVVMDGAIDKSHQQLQRDGSSVIYKSNGWFNADMEEKVLTKEDWRLEFGPSV